MLFCGYNKTHLSKKIIFHLFLATNELTIKSEGKSFILLNNKLID